MALAKARQYRCYLTHLDYHQKKEEEENENKKDYKKVTFLLFAEMMEERRRLHRYHSQHKFLCLTYMNLSLNYAYKEIKII